MVDAKLHKLLNMVPEARLVLAAGPLDGRGDVVGHVHREEGAHARVAAAGVDGVLGEVAVEGGGPVVEPLPGHAGLYIQYLSDIVTITL